MIKSKELREAQFKSIAELKSELQREVPEEKPKVQAVDNEGYKGKWITENGAHIFIRDGESLEQARERAHSHPITMSGTEVLTKTEWARYYDILGNMKNGSVRVVKSKLGKRVVVLICNETANEITPPRIILDNGRYVNPEIATVFTFVNEVTMADYAENM